jgi:hypothetical protein
MAYQMTITLSDEEFAALSAEAARIGKPLEAILHETLAPHVAQAREKHQPMSEAEFAAYLYQQGFITDNPTNEPLTSEEDAEITDRATFQWWQNGF